MRVLASPDRLLQYHQPIGAGGHSFHPAADGHSRDVRYQFRDGARAASHTVEPPRAHFHYS
jgi:hypothetical protein